MRVKKVRSHISLVIVLLSAFIVFGAHAEDQREKVGDVYIPDGMEVIKEGDVNVLVPKGGRLTKESSFLLKEGTDEYASRKFIATEGRLDGIDKELETIKRDLNDLKETVKSAKSKEEMPPINP